MKPSPGFQISKTLWFAIGASWFSFVIIGFVWLSRFANTAGQTAPTLMHWPADTTIPRIPGRMTLVMFAHPYCPCTRASVAELNRLMAVCDGRLDATVVFISMGKVTDAATTNLITAARAIPVVRVIQDAERGQADQFHATTSGCAYLFDGAGNCLFAGGITESRGHQGDNAGSAAILALVLSGVSANSRTPAFGCELFRAESSAVPQLLLPRKGHG